MDKDTKKEGQYIAVPTNNDISIDDFNNKEIKTEEDELAVGIGVLAETYSTKEVSPEIKPTQHPIEVSIGDTTKELGLVGIIKKNATPAQTIMGMNTSRKLTLWHSGFTVGVAKFSKPSASALTVMLGVNQAEIGLQTAGIAFNNESAMFIKDVIEFLESLVEVSSYPSKEPLREALITDLPFITLLALEDSIGIVKVCDKCSQRHETSSNWKDMIHVNLEDKTFLGQSKVSFKDIEKYKSEYMVDKTIEVEDPVMGTVTYELQIPTIGHYIEYGQHWLNTVIKDVDKMAAEATPAVKRSMLSTSFSTLKLQEYGHFIKSISIGDKSVTTIKDTIELITLLDADVHGSVVKGIKEFVKSNTVAVVGVPAFKCANPECESLIKSSTLEQTFNDTVVPINTMMSFLSLTNLKLTELAR